MTNLDLSIGWDKKVQFFRFCDKEIIEVKLKRFLKLRRDRVQSADFSFEHPRTSAAQQVWVTKRASDARL